MKQAERFLIEKFGKDVLKYTGFEYLCIVLSENDSLLAGKVTETYMSIANKYSKKWSSIERGIRTIKDRYEEPYTTNSAFMSGLILEYREWLSNETNRNV